MSRIYAHGATVSAIAAAAMTATAAMGSTCDDPSWTALSDGGFNHLVHKTAVADYGFGEHLYVMGDFTTLGGQEMNRIAQWDGENWSSLGIGTAGSVRQAVVFDDGTGPALYVGGVFQSAGNVPGTSRIARWDGENWTPVGGGVNSSIFAMAVYDDGNGEALYVGGVFTTAGGTPVNRVAKWDGQQWSALGSGVNSTMFELFVHDDGNGPRLFAGGVFTQAGGVAVQRFAAWDGTSWSDVGGGVGTQVTHSVLAMTRFDDGNGEALYVAGNFDRAGPISANNIARWDGQNWTALGNGTNSNINGLGVFDDGNGPELYAGGLFTNASGIPGTGGLAKWNGLTWRTVGNGANDWVISFSIYDDGGGPALFAGGHFTNIGGVAAERIARWGCPPSEGIVGDLNGDGVVNVADMLILLAAWGECDGDCPADLNGDGVVDVADLLMLLSNWG